MMSTDVTAASNNLKDFKLAVEYKYLIANAPGGVYIMPRHDNIRLYDGVIFIRRGIYRDGVFRFTLELPATYNSNNQYPVVTFSPPVFHPLIHPQTGRVNLKADAGMRNGWLADKHFLITVLVFVKRLFYLNSFDDFEEEEEDCEEKLIFNTEALNLFKKQQENCTKSAALNLPPTLEDECFTSFVQTNLVKKLNESIYQSHEPTNSCIVFTPDHAAIDNVRSKILK